MLTPINLQLGWPSPSLFPASSILSGASSVLTDPSKIADGLIYGPDEGYLPLRKSIAQWLSATYAHPSTGPNYERICITNGASGNLGNVLAKFTDSRYTRQIWMVEPSYFLACPIFHDAGFEGKLKGVPEDEEGLDIGFLRYGLQEAEKEATKSGEGDVPLVKGGAGYAKLYKHVIYLVPTFSNPSAKTLSLRRREELVRLAREFDALVVTDDVYDVLRWPEDPSTPVTRLGKPPPRIVDVDATLDGGPSEWGNTVSNGSFSKIIAPGCRVGWAEGTTAFAKQLSQVGSTRSGGAPSHMASTFVHEMLESGSLEKHISETLVPIYRSRYYTLMGAIKEHLVPLGFEISVGKPYEASLKSKTKVNGINSTNGTNGTNGTHLNGTSDPTKEAGGFFTYVLLPADILSASKLSATALEKYGLKFAFGDMFQVAGDAGSAERAEKGFGRGIRLCWAWHTEEDIKEGVRRLAMVAEETKSGKA